MTRRDLLVEPNPVVAAMAPYVGAPPDPLIDLKLDSNESASPLPPLDAEAAGWEPHRYMRTAPLEQRIAERYGIEPDRVLVTAGSDDAIERAMRAVCRPGRQAMLTAPAYEVLERYARLAGAEVAFVPWWSGDFPVAKACQRATRDTAIVVMVSPNNPTGAVTSRAALVELADRLPGALVLLDHAYVEYADRAYDLTEAALEHPNVLVLKTFSKAWSSAGLRVGYALGDSRVLRWLRTLGQPYPVAAPSVVMVSRLLDAPAQPPASRISRVRSERVRLVEVLEDLGAETLPSHANFVLARVGDAAWVRRALVSLGVGVRSFPGRPGLEEYVRITVPEGDAASTRLRRALRTVVAPQALLFDMDGVLADESRSYREAIRRTAASYGVEVTAADIARAKAEGSANNDWELTRRLLSEHGKEPPAEEVVSRFELIYQGDGSTPGLWPDEDLLADRGWLLRQAARRPLGIVTGRPLRDARRFLEKHGVSDCFAAVVAMEDAPPKPDPAPVLLALERLGVDHAWMVGDTPDDMRAARAAGVLPVGCRAPGDAAVPEGALIEAGAVCVLDSVSDLEEVLP